MGCKALILREADVNVLKYKKYLGQLKYYLVDKYPVTSYNWLSELAI